MRLKRINVVQCSSGRREKRNVVRRSAPGKMPWDNEAESLRWTESESEEINAFLVGSGVTYSALINEVKRLYHSAVPMYERFCSEMGERPTDEGLSDFARRALDRYLGIIGAKTVH